MSNKLTNDYFNPIYMQIRDSLLAYLNLSDQIKSLEPRYQKLLGHPVNRPTSNIAIEDLQAVLNYNAELDLLEDQLEKLKGELDRIKNSLIANLAEAGLKANVGISFLLIDEESFATFHYTNDAELVFVY